jgi:hypothetical protein
LTYHRRHTIEGANRLPDDELALGRLSAKAEELSRAAARLAARRVKSVEITD